MNATVGGLFDGIGLLAYGLHLAGWGHSWLCEVDPWRREILELRWPGVPIYDDVRAVDARAERPLLIAGGFPCKGASTAGLRNGFDHPETVLWGEMARALGELRPRYVLVENVANLLAVRDGAVWGEVLGDLASLGYDTVWDCIPAAAFGAPHLRDRVIAVATYADPSAANLDDLRPGQPDTDRRAPADSDGARERWNGGQRLGTDGRSDARRVAVGATSDTKRDSLRQQPEPIGGSKGAPGTRRGTAPARDADSNSARPARSQRRGEPQGAGRPIAVEWGEYEPAIRRWERALGRRAGEPLLQGVVARSARRMVRSRLSALGDGVQVQLGVLAGEYILELERERLEA